MGNCSEHDHFHDYEKINFNAFNSLCNSTINKYNNMKCLSNIIKINNYKKKIHKKKCDCNDDIKLEKFSNHKKIKKRKKIKKNYDECREEINNCKNKVVDINYD